METIGLFLLRSAAWLTSFAVIYLLVLRNERYFRLNRYYLLAGIVASLLFPFYAFHYTVILPSVTTTATSVGVLSRGTILPEEPSFPYLFWIYVAGISAVVMRMLLQTGKIILKLRKAGYERTGEVKLVRTPDFASSFSFFSFVFVNPSIAPIEMEEIIHHEREHIQQRHWFDLLLVELICIVQWFNPVAWIYARLIRQNHEYLADESALQSTADPAIYQAALLNQLLGEPVFSFTNSFSYSLNKKRFTMMKKKINSPFRKLKMLLVLPMAAMLFYAFAVPEYQYGTDISTLLPEAKTVNVKGRVFKADGTPLPGTSVILRGSTIGTMSGPEGKFELKGIPEDGEIFFSFVGFKTVVQKVNTQPMKIVMEVGNVKIDKITVVAYGTNPSAERTASSKIKIRDIDNANPPLFYLDGEEITQKQMEQISSDQIESMQVLKDESATTVYGEKGKNGVILITSKDKAKEDKVATAGTSGPKSELSKTNAKGEKEVFVVVEEMPEFPGGSSALRNFIAKVIKYPAEARRNKIQGKVFVSFVVSTSGKVEDAKVVKSVNPLLDAESLRVVNMMPDWKPAKQRGQAVSVAYTVPIEFILQ